MRGAHSCVDGDPEVVRKCIPYTPQSELNPVVHIGPSAYRWIVIHS